MLIRDGRNIHGIFRVVSSPVYVAESKNGRPYCKFRAIAKDAVDAEKTEDREYELIIFGDAAIPASKTILMSALLKVWGRSAPNQYFRRDKICLFVDCWEPVCQDPYNYVEILKAQMQLLANRHLGNLYRAIGSDEENSNQ